MTVAELLEASMAAHNRAKALRTGKRPDKVGARVALLEARDRRRQALQADPEREDPAWALEQGRTAAGADTHESLMAFYADMLRES